MSNDEDMDEFLRNAFDTDDNYISDINFPDVPTTAPVITIIPDMNDYLQEGSRYNSKKKKELIDTRKQRYDVFIDKMYELFKKVRQDYNCNTKYARLLKEIKDLTDSLNNLAADIKLYRGGNKRFKTKKVKRFKMKYSKRKYRL